MSRVAWFRAWRLAAAMMACGISLAHADLAHVDLAHADDANPADASLDTTSSAAPSLADSNSLAQLVTTAAADNDPLSGGARPERFLYFGGFDLWRGGGSTHTGLLIAPKGLDQDGFLVKLLAGQGSYLYRLGATNIRGTYILGSVMAGWRASRDGVEVKVFAGPDLQYHRFAPLDPFNRLAGTHLGLRIGIETWWQINRDAMLSGSLSASTIGYGYGLRGAAGWRVADAFYLGPEIETSGDRTYRQLRAGAHATALKTGRFEWSAGVGYVIDNSRRSGVYGRLGVLTRY